MTEQERIKKIKSDAARVGISLDYKPNVNVPDISSLTHQQWLESRQAGIGGSDAGSLLGVSHFKSALDIYLSKTQPVDDSGAAPDVQYRFDMGHAMESVIMAWYGNTTHRKVWVDPAQYSHPLYPWMVADLDGMSEIDGREIGLEFKTTNVDSQWQWHSGIEGETTHCPNLGYVVQVRHYMAVRNLYRYDLCCAFCNDASKNVVITFYRDMEFEKELIEAEKNFWLNHVVKRKAPLGNLSDDALDAMLKRAPITKPNKEDPYTVDDKKLVKAAKKWLALKDAEAKANARVKALKEKEPALKAALLDGLTLNEELGIRISDALVDIDGVTFVVKRSESERNGFDSAALKLKYPDLAEEFKKPSTTTTFSVKPYKAKKK